MILSTYSVSQIVEQCLKTVGMLSLSKHGLTVNNILDKLHQGMIDIVNAHFPDDKANYYETRLAGGITNGKFGATGNSYDSITQELTPVLTIGTPSANDIGKLALFFDGDATPPTWHYGVISNYISTGTPRYVITPFYDIPTLTNVTNLMIGSVLLSGDVLKFTAGNEILSSENLEIYDVSNLHVIDVVSEAVFNQRLKLNTWKEGTTRWARFKQTAIEFNAGSNAPPMGTLMISAYWSPPRPTSMADGIHLSDTRIPELVKYLTQYLYADKLGQPVPTSPPAQLEERHRGG